MHFKHIITVSSQRFHILKTLKHQGLSLELLHCVFHAIILNKILYTISAWYGFYRTMLCIRSTSHGPVSVRLSVTSRCSIETAERIELVLACEFPSTRPTLC